MIIGLTGEMGAGKSTAAQMLRKTGLPVFDADGQVHLLMKNNKELKDIFKEKFKESVTENGIDRTVLSRLISEGKMTPEIIEKLIYPFLIKELDKFIDLNDPAVLDVPLLFEAGWDKYCDKIVFLTASPETLRQRVFARPGMTEEKYEALTSRFWNTDLKKSKSDYIISTDEGLEPVERRLIEIRNELCAKSF